jgi:adenosylcobinamide amidohydrolase
MESKPLETGGVMTADDNAIVCRFSRPRLVLSSSAYNGGYLMADGVFNHRLSFFVDSEAELPGGSQEEYLAMVAADMGFIAGNATGLLPNARMNCQGYSAERYRELIVEVVATAGVEANAARAGDPACYYEHEGGYRQVGGTINIFAFTNVSLPHGTMAKAMISITEAKAAALQELAVMSPMTLNPATGTGTDGVIIACDPAAAFIRRDAGTQSELGELFCRAAGTAVRQALARECGIEPGRQGTVAERLRRAGIAPETVPELQVQEPQAKILLAVSQAVWQEYRWGLLDIDELQQFFTILERTAAPLGEILSSVLRAKQEATASKSRMNKLSGGVK